MTLNEVMTQIADAIREKKGTTEKIAPINFAEEIKSISAGGGESGGGSNLSPDAIVYEPNGWYWKWVEGVPSDFKESAAILLSLTYDLGARYYEGILQDTTVNSIFKSRSILFLGANIITMHNFTDNEGVCVIAVAESKYCSVKVGDTTTLTGNSMYEIANQAQPMTEAEFDNFMQTNIGLQRITKEEYESLLTTE